MRNLTGRIAAADAFILVTPEYNHSYPASLKAVIDWHFTQWVAKPVAFVSYGGAAVAGRGPAPGERPHRTKRGHHPREPLLPQRF